MPPPDNIDEVERAANSVAARCEGKVNKLGDIAALGGDTVRRRDVEDTRFAVARKPLQRDASLGGQTTTFILFS